MAEAGSGGNEPGPVPYITMPLHRLLLWLFTIFFVLAALISVVDAELKRRRSAWRPALEPIKSIGAQDVRNKAQAKQFEASEQAKTIRVAKYRAALESEAERYGITRGGKIRDTSELRYRPPPPPPASRPGAVVEERRAQDAEFERSLAEDQLRAERQRVREEELAAAATVAAAVAAEEAEAARKAATEQSKAAARLRPEPPAATAFAIVQFKFPDSSTCVRRFDSEASVTSLFDLIHSQGWSPDGHTLTMAFPKSRLDDPAQSLADAGVLGRVALHVEARFE